MAEVYQKKITAETNVFGGRWERGEREKRAERAMGLVKRTIMRMGWRN
jgi:ribosomal protein S19E (S16A)